MRPLVDNAPLARSAKIEIRHLVMREIPDPRVFDAFAGAGVLHRKVWREAAAYVGCDKRRFDDDRRMFVADNRRVLRAVDLSAFNIFDLDAHGSPWEQAIIVAARRRLDPGERIGLVVTEGNGETYVFNVVSAAVANLTGLRAPQVGLLARRPQIHNAMLAELARRMGGTVVRRWQAHGRTGAKVVYLGAVFEAGAKADGAGLGPVVLA